MTPLYTNLWLTRSTLLNSDDVRGFTDEELPVDDWMYGWQKRAVTCV